MTFKFLGKDALDAMNKIHDYCKEPESKYILLVEKAKQKRSLNQNRYYWGVVVKIISDYTGFTDNEVHQILGRNLWSYKKDDQTFVRSTTDMDTQEFEIAMTAAREFGQESIGVYIPEPNEVTNEMWMMLQSKNPKI